MKKIFLLLATGIFLFSCNNNSAPDVSGIKVDATIARFETDFFAIDTNKTILSVETMERKHPYFFKDFLENIVLGGVNDTTLDLAQSINAYYKITQPLGDSVKKVITDLKNVSEQLHQGYQYIRYYFPEYQLPKPVTYVGLIGDPSVALTQDAMAIGLQMYLGKNFSAYNTPEAQQFYPQYISRRFEKEYIVANCFQNLVQDIYPGQQQRNSLLELMVEKGKQWYLLDKIMPEAADSLKTGYTAAQLKWCEENEGMIWNFLMQVADIYTTEPTIIQNFIGEAPKTDGMPDTSPGNIGQWIGWQIVKAYAKENDGLNLKQILQTEPRKLFEASRYKPR
ncbi:MAG: hypothetical protein SFU21_08575 [Flavihumibacter sp.]|nr:hypothetical protein [Flavihumibacter sp.]